MVGEQDMNPGTLAPEPTILIAKGVCWGNAIFIFSFLTYAFNQKILKCFEFLYIEREQI